MKKSFAAVLAVALLLAGCMSAPIDIDDKEIEPFNVEGSSEIPDMEFIGFKADANALGENTFTTWKRMRDMNGLKNLGAQLQVGGIAVDQSYGYFGIYSFQELEAYKSTKRYVTFVEVQDNQFIISSDAMAGWRTFCIATIVLAPIGLSNFNSTTTVKGTYNIYVFDTVSRTIKYKDSLTVSHTDKWNGDIGSSSAEQIAKMYEYYGTMISNTILEKYTKIKALLKRGE